MHCPSIPVLLYHQVGDAPGRFVSTIPQFESHMRYLVDNGYRSVTSKEYEACARGEMQAPRKAVMITFDDGFLCTYSNVFPVLSHLGMKAVMFVITGTVGEGSSRHGGASLALDGGAHLLWSELAEMKLSGTFEVHSHSHTHARWFASNVGAAASLPAVEADLAMSRHLLTERLGAGKMSHLAWPWGASTEGARTLASRLGFQFQYAVRTDFNTGRTPLDQINRLCMDGVSLPVFAARLEFFRHSLFSRPYRHLRQPYDWLRRRPARR